MFSVISYQENVNQTLNNISPPTLEDSYSLKGGLGWGIRAGEKVENQNACALLVKM